MYFISTNSKDFPFEQAKTLYNANKKYFLPLDITFEALCKSLNGNLWGVMIENNLAGLIYFEFKEGKWFLSGCSQRKQFKHVAEAINGLCELYFEQTDAIYSETDFTHSKLALKRAGFKHYKDNIYRKDKK